MAREYGVSHGMIRVPEAKGGHCIIQGCDMQTEGRNGVEDRWHCVIGNDVEYWFLCLGRLVDSSYRDDDIGTYGLKCLSYSYRRG